MVTAVDSKTAVIVAEFRSGRWFSRRYSTPQRATEELVAARAAAGAEYFALRDGRLIGVVKVVELRGWPGGLTR